MPTRRRLNPDPAPAPGMSATRDAYRLCARPGCAHPRVRHAGGPLFPCAALAWAASYDHPDSPEQTARPCACEGFQESE